MVEIKKKKQQTMKVYEDNDQFFDKFWEHIDKAKDVICITTYDMDHKNIAGLTLRKLRNAANRGVKVFILIDDLNFYVNKQEIRDLEKAGGMVIRNQPFRYFYYHLMDFRLSPIFNRNHQKVMLVDDNLFCGSLNIANPYSRVRYGEGEFRDLNIVLTRQNCSKVRDFFREMIVRNSRFYPDMIKPEKINQYFKELDEKYENEYGKFFEE